jgi:hypothetical protein
MTAIAAGRLQAHRGRGLLKEIRPMGGFSHAHWAVALGVCLVFVAMYFVPALVAVLQHHPHGIGIFLVNLVFGWTVIGWLGCLAWALIRPSQGLPTGALTPPPTPG